MPKVESRRLRSGSTRYFVRFRNPHTGKDSSRVFDVKMEAAAFARDLVRVGAQRALENLDDHGKTAEPTLDVWAETHIASLVRITDGTRLGYRRMYDRVWHKRLGHLRLSEITYGKVAGAINDYAQTVTGKGKARNLVSDKTVANAHGLLAAMMRSALREGLIQRDPCEHVKLPERTSHLRVEHRFLTHAEFGRLLEEIPDHYRPLVMFLFGTGCRWGEAVALEVGDVDLDQRTVRITKAEKYDPSKSRWQVGPPKTPESRRTITLPPELVAALEPLTVARGRTERLFTAPRGGSVVHRRFWGDVWKPAVARAGLDPEPRIHDARHTHVAWLIAAGVALPVIQKRLGHKSITTTIDTYGHLLPDLQRAAGDAASAAFSGLDLAPPAPRAVER